jgi:hypothetical protein
MSASPALLDRTASISERSAFSSSQPDLRGQAAYRCDPLDWRSLADGVPPERDWAIRHWLGMGHVTLLASLGGMGKTLLAQMLGSALALQRPMLDEVPSPRRVLMWAAEDDHDELWRRQVAIAAHFSVDLGVFAGKFYVESFSDRDCTLMDVDQAGHLGATRMLEELREQVRDYRAEVVILDNSARLFGGKESDRNQVTRFMAELNGAAARDGAPGAAILLLAHVARGMGSEYSGSSAWENAARARLFLSDREPDAKMFEPRDADEEIATDQARRFLSKRKSNYSARDLRTFRYEAGVLVPENPPSAGGIVASLDSKRDETIVVDSFRKLVAMDQQPTDGPTSPLFLPKLILQFGLAEGRTKADLAKAMRRLMLDGRFKKGTVGRYQNRAPRLGLILSEEASP